MRAAVWWAIGLALVVCVAVAAAVGQFTYVQPERGAAVGVAATVLAALLAALAIWWSVWQARQSARDAQRQRVADHRLAVLRDLSDLQDLGLPEPQRRLRARTLLVALAAPDLPMPALRAWAGVEGTDAGEDLLRRIVLESGASLTAEQYDAMEEGARRTQQGACLRWRYNETDPRPTPWSQETESALRQVLEGRA